MTFEVALVGQLPVHVGALACNDITPLAEADRSPI